MEKGPQPTGGKNVSDGRTENFRTDGRTEHFRTDGRTDGRTEKFRTDGKFSDEWKIFGPHPRAKLS